MPKLKQPCGGLKHAWEAHVVREVSLSILLDLKYTLLYSRLTIDPSSVIPSFLLQHHNIISLYSCSMLDERGYACTPLSFRSQARMQVFSISFNVLIAGLPSADEHLSEARRLHAEEKRRVKARQGRWCNYVLWASKETVKRFRCLCSNWWGLFDAVQSRDIERLQKAETNCTAFPDTRSY